MKTNLVKPYKLDIENLNYSITYHDILCSMTLEDQVTLLDPFTHTLQDHQKIKNFDFVRENSATEKVRIEETFCTIVTVGGKYLHKNTLSKVIKKVDEIRKIIRQCRHYMCVSFWTIN